MAAVQSCHAKGVIHRDLCPSNILLTTKKDGSVEPKLADFHSAVRLPAGQRASGMVGHLPFMAPELIRGEMYDKAVDTWSLGVLLFNVLSGASSPDKQPGRVRRHCHGR